MNIENVIREVKASLASDLKADSRNGCSKLFLMKVETELKKYKGDVWLAACFPRLMPMLTPVIEQSCGKESGAIYGTQGHQM